MQRFIFSLALIVIGPPKAWSGPKITAVVNAASFQSGLPAGGGLATVFCSGVPNVNPGTYIAPSSSPLPNWLGGLQVVVNGALAPLLAVVITSSGDVQINFQVPLERNASISYGSIDRYAGFMFACGDTLAPLPVRPHDRDPHSPFSWGGFFSDANGYAIALHSSDYRFVTQQNPARAGEAIIAYANDFFTVWPPPPVGFPVPQQLLFSSAVLPTTLYLQDKPEIPNCMATVCSGGQPTTAAIQVTFEGLVPGMVGVEQINFVVPINQHPGDWALFFNESVSGAGFSSPYVKLPVR